tara:strand:- start:299 stop:697 length:399 start_codon:yes stop_codon:yes gene_type:complete
MSKLLGLNNSNVLEVIQSVGGALKVIDVPTQYADSYVADIPSGTYTQIFDCRNFRSIRLYGNQTTAYTSLLEYSFNNDDGNYGFQVIDKLDPLIIEGSVCINKVIDTPPSYFRIKNISGITQTYSLRIQKVQ